MRPDISTVTCGIGHAYGHYYVSVVGLAWSSALWISEFDDLPNCDKFTCLAFQHVHDLVDGGIKSLGASKHVQG